MSCYDKTEISQHQELHSLMLKCAELAEANDKLTEQVDKLLYRIENLRGTLYQIENINREDEDLASWWAQDCLQEDNKAAKEDADEQR